MVTDENVVHSLWALAEETLHSYNFKEAIYFLESICNSSLRMIPQLEVRTRLRLAEVLLKHTDDVDCAKEHLDHAVCPSFLRFHSIG
jgi:MAternally-affected-uncoordination protein